MRKDRELLIVSFYTHALANPHSKGKTLLRASLTVTFMLSIINWASALDWYSS